MHYLEGLPKQDLISLLDICYEARMAKSLHQFQSCFHKLKKLILFDGAFSVYADKEVMGKNKRPDFFYQTIDISSEFIDTYIKDRYYENSSVCQTILQTWLPLNWKTSWAGDLEGNGINSRNFAMDFGYLDGWTCANYHSDDRCLSVLNFAGKKVERDHRTDTILKYITPHLSEALKSIFNPSLKKRKAAKRMNISSNDLEVLRWIEDGKSLWDMSVLMNKSENTIKREVGSLRRKLNAQNQTHAVAIAMRQGLIK